MSLIDPHDFSAGESPTAAEMQTLTDAIVQMQGGTPSIGDALDLFAAVQATAQTGLAASTGVPISFAASSEIIDVAAGHDIATNNTRYYPKNAGIVEVSGVVAYAASASGIRRLSQINLNGAGIPGSQAGGPPLGAQITCVATPVVYVAVNGTTDYLELVGFADYASWGTVVSAAAASRLSVKFVHS